MLLFLSCILFLILILYALIQQFRAKSKLLYQKQGQVEYLQSELRYYTQAIDRQKYLNNKQAIYWNRIIAKRKRYPKLPN
jgi:hypothetical protein